MARWTRWGCRSVRFWLVAAVAAGPVSIGAATPPGSDVDPSIDEKLDEMYDEILRLRDNNERLQDEVAELRAQSGDQWLTEQRATEIRTIVSDVLADADVRAGYLQDALVAGWSEHFFLASPDGRFKLQFDGQLQFRWIYNYTPEQLGQFDKHLQGFEMSRAKLTFRGHVFNPDLTFLIRTDPTRNEPGLVNGLYFLQDAWIQYRFDNNLSARIGQFKLPFNREELVHSSRQLAVERSLVSENTTTGRTQGIELTWLSDTSKFSIATGDGAKDSILGLGNLAGTQPVNSAALRPDVEYAFTARYEKLLAGEWAQFADFTSPPGDEYGLLIGIGGHFQQTEGDGLFSLRRNEQRWTAVTADISVEWGGANMFTSYTWVYIDHGNFGQINIHGIVVQGGIYVTPKTEIFSRWEYGWVESRFDFSDLHVATLGVNYYLDGHDVKWTTDIGFALGQVDQVWFGGPSNDLPGYRISIDANEPEIVFRTQFQLLF